MKHNEPGDLLTARQWIVFDYIRDRIEQGISPTLREIGDACYDHCTVNTRLGSANGCVQALIQKGYIRKYEKISRGLALTELGKQ